MQTAEVISPLDIGYSWEDPRDLNPGHGIDRPEDAETITGSLKADGWHGAPVIIDHGQILHGHHRTHAAIAAGVQVPCVEAEDILTACGINPADYDCGYGIEWEQAFAALPAEVISAYGIDL